MVKRIVLTTVVVILFAFAAFQIIGTNIGQLQDSYVIEDEEAQDTLVQELEERGIEFRLDQKNRIWFNPKDGDKVREVAHSVMLSAEPSAITFGYSDPQYTDLLEKRLEQVGVHYERKVVGGEKRLRLEYSDKEAWGPIKRRVDELFLEGKLNLE